MTQRYGFSNKKTLTVFNVFLFPGNIHPYSVRITNVMRGAYGINHFYRTLIPDGMNCNKKQRLKKRMNHNLKYT
jgi:hypothetical protein